MMMSLARPSSRLSCNDRDALHLIRCVPLAVCRCAVPQRPKVTAFDIISTFSEGAKKVRVGPAVPSGSVAACACDFRRVCVVALAVVNDDKGVGVACAPVFMRGCRGVSVARRRVESRWVAR